MKKRFRLAPSYTLLWLAAAMVAAAASCSDSPPPPSAGPACSGSLSRCDGACVDTRNDPENCGDCSTACASGQACLDSACVASGCDDGQTRCGDACVDTQTAAENCGAC